MLYTSVYTTTHHYAIVCSGCGGKFHIDVICVGVDDEVISCLLRVRNGALQYFCCKCHRGANGVTGVPADQSGSLLDQLLRVVGSLSGRVREMTDKIERNRVMVVMLVRGSWLAWKGMSREDMRVQFRELHEQEKRQTSVVLKGFNSADQDIVKKKFDDICALLNVGQVSLSGLSRIGETGLFRAKIEDKEKRSFLLSRVKELHSSEAFRYIQRDLTYKQRQEIVARRSTFNVSGGQMSHQRSGGLSSFLRGSLAAGTMESRGCNGSGQDSSSGFVRGNSGCGDLYLCLAGAN